MQITPLSSGSQGNSLLLETGKTKVLIDAGLPWAAMLGRLDAVFEDPSSLSAIVVTHEHADHARSVRRLSLTFSLPVYASERTFRHPSLKSIKKKQIFEPMGSFQVGDFEIFPLRLPHDSDPTFGFIVEAEGKRFGMATDLGTPTEEVRKGLKGCKTLFLEFNHDLRMLREGPYPSFLKERVGGPLGHLSNDQATELLRTLLHDELECLILGHLSETNNRPELAMESAQRILVGEGMNKTVVTVAPQHSVGKTVNL